MNDAPQPSPEGIYKGSWTNRRRVVFLTLLYCAGMVLYLAVFGSDTAIHQQISIALIGLAAAVIGSYVFGAVWDDHSIRRFQGGGQ